MTTKKFELVFVGGTNIRYRRWHSNIAAAVQTAYHVLSKIQDRAAHPAIVYGPGCGKDGITYP